jgi:hypothetical protein
MNFVGRLCADQIVEAFKDDHCVKALGRPWPSTEFERLQVLKDAHRPADNILKLAWSLYTLDRDQALRIVHLTVWTPSLYLGETIDAFKNNNPAPPAKVANLAAKWKGGGFDPDEFMLIGYEISSTHIQLEDGYNSSAAAGLAGVLPAKIRICLGQKPVIIS